MKTFVMPTDENLPAALAEAMGWKFVKGSKCLYDTPEGGRHYCGAPSGGLTWDGAFRFSPLTDRNHSRLAVEKCAELDILGEYKDNLIEESWKNHSRLHTACLIATPSQESRAAYRTLWEHNNKEQP